MKARVLLAEDDAAMRRLTADLLHSESYEVKAAPDLEKAWSVAATWRPDLVVLDLQFPGGNGLDFCRRLKTSATLKDCLVLVITARGGSGDMVEGLQAGADDYLAKPFHERVFLARVEALLRRRGAFAPTAAGQDLEHGGLRLSRREHRAWLEGRELKLTLREFEVVAALVSAPGEALTREQIIERAWGPDTVVVPKAVDVHINHLRQKLGPAGAKVQAVPQVGYRWKA